MKFCVQYYAIATNDAALDLARALSWARGHSLRIVEWIAGDEANIEAFMREMTDFCRQNGVYASIYGDSADAPIEALLTDAKSELFISTSRGTCIQAGKAGFRWLFFDDGIYVPGEDTDEKQGRAKREEAAV